MSHHHHHGHAHHHGTDMSHLNRAFVIGIVLNILFVVIEVIAGFATNSLALLSDAGHNLSDVASLALALMAFRLAKVKPGKNFTYGYSKTTVLVALANAVILLVAVGGIGYESFHRFMHPEPVEGMTVAIVAGIGIVINSVSAFLFFSDKDKDLNVRGAYLHLVADALVSLGVVIAGVIIIYTGWYWVDALISIVIMVVILYSTWGLLTDSVRLSLDGVPREIDVEQVKKMLCGIKGIHGVHHVHVWAISTTVNALTAHLVIDENTDAAGEQQLKELVKHELLHMNIQHATLETERGQVDCQCEEC